MTALNLANKHRATRIFTIDLDNNVEVHTSKNPGPSTAGQVKFQSEDDLAALAASWPGSRLVEIWNKLPGVERVGKFIDRRTAVRRLWGAIGGLEPRDPKHEATRGDTAPRRASVAAKSNSAVQTRTKTEDILALLKRPSGVTLNEIMELTGWQSHSSVRGFISTQSKKLRLQIKSFKRNGERVYRIGS